MTKLIDPRIADILRQRRALGVEIAKTPTLRAQSVDLPGVGTAPDPNPAKSVMGTPPSSPVSDTELAALLDGVLPQIDGLIRKAIADIKSDGRLTMAEALALVPEIRNIISLVVGEMLPQIKGQSAYNLVALLISVLVQQYVAPYLPPILRGYLTPQAIRVGLSGLQSAYDTWVKPRLSQGGTP